MRTATIYIAALLSALLVASCGTTRLSRQDLSDFDAGRKAIVRADNNPLLVDIVLMERPVVRIWAVDSRQLDTEIFNLNDQIAVDVGHHEIELGCVDRAEHSEEDFSETIEMDLKPYHMYLVSCWFESGFKIEEKLVK